jgi:hypothetical protein
VTRAAVAALRTVFPAPARLTVTESPDGALEVTVPQSPSARPDVIAAVLPDWTVAEVHEYRRNGSFVRYTLTAERSPT